MQTRVGKFVRKLRTATRLALIRGLATVATIVTVVTVASIATVVTAAAQAARIEIRPASLSLRAGDSVAVTAVVYDSSGNVIAEPVAFYSSNRMDFRVSRDGHVRALKGGEFRLGARSLTDRSLRVTIPVTVAAAPVAHLTLRPTGERFFVGATVRHEATIVDAVGLTRADVAVRWSTSDPDVAAIDRSGLLTAFKPGTVTVTAHAGGVTAEHRYRVVASPIRTLSLTLSADSARTGDVVRAEAVALDARGRRVDDAPIRFTLIADAEDTTRAQFPPAEVDQQGRFVAYKAGHYTVVALSAGHTAQRSVTIANRRVSRTIQLVGRAAVRNAHTSDLWVWEGNDGRDYAITGTWGANGAAYFWDVTDPANQTLVDSVVVDARTVNDVKVSEDGRICVISREGASNRRNGIVILDCSNPLDVRVVSTFDDDLTGGVHNLFIYRDHVYAVNNGRKYDIINIEDPARPRRVGVFELDTPGHAIHDVWIVDGIAYSSNWGDGVVMVDVGNGKWGGSPSNPIEIGRFTSVGGRNHAAFPYRSPTGKFYVFMGDEIFPYGLDTEPGGTPTRAAGYIHIIDLTDPENPEEVARYEVPEAGSHNFWIEDDKLYAAFYNGGLRVVDISGELKGNLYYQNREIANFISYDPQGVIANAPFVWGPQPHKGNIFFSDWNSGLWTVKLEPPEMLTP